MIPIIALDFISQYLFCTSSVATNLATSVELNPIHCATMLCYFGQTRSGSLATHFDHLSSTALSSATGGDVVVPKLLGQNEELPGSTEERTKKGLSFVPKSEFKRCNYISAM